MGKKGHPMTAPDHLSLETEIHDLFSAKLREFAAFCAEHWTMTPKDMLELLEPCEHPNAYRQGYNAAMTTGIEGALDHWLDEMGYAR
jgi:hypothetical protein